MRNIKRYIVLVLCLSLGNLSGLSQARTSPDPAQSAETTEPAVIDSTSVENDGEKEADLGGQTIKFGPVEPTLGYLNTSTVLLRESPEATAPIIAKLETGEYEAAVILATTRDFVRIRLSTNEDTEAEVPRREREYEGWTTWDSIVPGITALVLDVESGKTVARVPLTEGLSSVVYSPDGSRAIFFNGAGGIGNSAYEVRTSDYTFTRTLASTEGEQFGTLFYGPADGSLYANAYSSNPRVIRIGNEGGANIPFEVAPNIKLSPDGRLGFVSDEKVGDRLNVDVIDLATLAIRNSFVLAGNAASNVQAFVLNKDGSELYIQLEDDSSPISVIDTRTGQILRELPIPPGQGYTYFSEGDVVGDSVLVRVFTESENEEVPLSKRYWVTAGQRTLAEPGVAFATEAGGKRLAVNDDGTELFKLDDKNRVQERIKIDRPERGTDRGAGSGLTVFGLSVSPDGKHVIMFVGTEHGC